MHKIAVGNFFIKLTIINKKMIFSVGILNLLTIDRISVQKKRQQNKIFVAFFCLVH